MPEPCVASPLHLGGWSTRTLCTCRDVERWIIATFVAFTETPVYSVARNRFAPWRSDMAPGTFDWLAFSAEVLGRDSPERVALLTWARTKARARIRRHRRLRLLRDVPGGTVSDYCLEAGIWRRTFDRRRKRACQRLADARNAYAATE